MAAAAAACLYALDVDAFCVEEEPNDAMDPPVFFALSTSNAACTARKSSSDPPLSG